MKGGTGLQGIQGIQGIQGDQGEQGPAGDISAIAARADQLIAALEANTDILKRVLGRQKWQNYAIGALAALLIAVSVFAYTARQAGDRAEAAAADAQEAVISSCESGNSVRGGLLKVALFLEANNASHPGGPTDTQAQLIAQMREDFALRDCTAIIQDEN